MCIYIYISCATLPVFTRGVLYETRIAREGNVHDEYTFILVFLMAVQSLHGKKLVNAYLTQYFLLMQVTG